MALYERQGSCPMSTDNFERVVTNKEVSELWTDQEVTPRLSECQPEDEPTPTLSLTDLVVDVRQKQHFDLHETIYDVSDEQVGGSQEINQGEIDYSSAKAFLYSDLGAKHMTPIQDVECALGFEIINEKVGWQLHHDQPMLKTWTKNFEVRGKEVKCVKATVFYPNVTDNMLAYLMANAEARLEWDDLLTKLSFHDVPQSGDLKNSGNRTIHGEIISPWPLSKRYFLQWSKVWKIPCTTVTADGTEHTQFKYMALNRTCRHPDVARDIESSHNAHGHIPIEAYMQGFENHAGELNGQKGCYQSFFMMADLGGHLPAWAMKLIISPFALKQLYQHQRKACDKLRPDVEKMKFCDVWCKEFYATQVFEFDLEAHRKKLEKEEKKHAVFATSHNKKDYFQRCDSMSGAEVTLAKKKKPSFLRRSFHRMGSFIKRKHSREEVVSPKSLHTPTGVQNVNDTFERNFHHAEATYI